MNKFLSLAVVSFIFSLNAMGVYVNEEETIVVK